MLRFFKRRRPQHRAERPVVEVSTSDRIVAAYYRLTPEQWAEKPAIVKADMREQVAWETRQAS